MCTISCKVDDDVKTNSEAIFESLGITMSAAINMFLRATIREEGLPINTKLKTRAECHIQPDWRLVYRIIEDCLILELCYTGTHSDLF